MLSMYLNRERVIDSDTGEDEWDNGR